MQNLLSRLLGCCLTHDASLPLSTRDFVWLIEALCRVDPLSSSVSFASQRLVALAEADDLSLLQLSTLTRAFTSNAHARLDKEKDKSFVVEGNNEALWRALEASAVRQLARPTGGAAEVEEIDRGALFARFDTTARLVDSFTTAGKLSVTLIEAAKPLVLSALPDAALPSRFPLHVRLSMLYNLAKACEAVSLKDRELLAALSKGFEALLTEEAQATASARRHSAPFLRLAYTLACLGEMARQPLPFAKLVQLHFPAEVVQSWSPRSDFKARRMATQLARVYAGLRAIATTNDDVAKVLGVSTTLNSQTQAQVQAQAAAIFLASESSIHLETSDMQKDVYRRLKAISARKKGWPAPLSEACTQFGFHADILLTLKKETRVLPPTASKIPRAELGRRVFEIALGAKAERPLQLNASDIDDPVLRLLSMPSVSGIAIELDGPDHLALHQASPGGHSAGLGGDPLARARAVKWLESLEAVASKAGGEKMVPGSVIAAGAGASVGGRIDGVNDSLATSGELLDAVLQVHHQQQSGDVDPSLEGSGAASANKRSSFASPAVFTTGLNLRTVYRKWLLKQYGWVALSLSHADYDASVKYADAATAERFLEDLLRRHAEMALERLAK